MTTPPAALAVIRAALEDAPIADLLQRPGWTAQRLAVALELTGWTISPTAVRSAPHAGTQPR
ncbi:hypothetical protein AB0D33_38110 [Streptomyces sp. NPDC048404]|uniref:hypothetical protein n=1 Tax=unclassified Streptomyces TaxID=2593676 RepID=UPI00343FB51D